MSTKQQKKVEEPVIYCGPTVRTVDLRANAVFNAGVPSVYEDVVKECPSVGALFIPISQLLKVQNALKNSSSPESILYRNIQKYVGGDN